MIKNKKDLVYYMKQDKIALKAKGGIKDYFFNDILKFQTILRKTEYYYNTKKNLRFLIFKIRLKKISNLLGFSIPINTCGPGLSIAHVGTIVINGKARIGKNCRIHVCVNIGAAAENSSSVPTIGDDCYIGPGAKLFGDINLGDNIAIGANSVVNKSFDGNCVIGGAPAKVISRKILDRNR
ncbi:serine acetyltransferase [Vibrio cyclitrophicus ZF170]|uniref:serine O-acetyltransferase n=1 Tax=Vibrio cyclitrophicus TaxID=47951 RepID=UPI000372BE12|nr:hypothetical protein [Vibrio cyclitrophicus]OBT04369.1 serine acetyltransferase [Vibrio cyclitrophicus]OEE23115.1 serine acetyltransferase [Vibrio cyclitrophicus ZF170]